MLEFVPISLDGKRFSPIQNSKSGRVSSDAVFVFKQSGIDFSATYSGEGFSDGHLIGRFKSEHIATLVYHCRASEGILEAGTAEAVFSLNGDDKLTIKMNWRWLNGNQASGHSEYREL